MINKNEIVSLFPYAMHVYHKKRNPNVKKNISL